MAAYTEICLSNDNGGVGSLTVSQGQLYSSDLSEKWECEFLSTSESPTLSDMLEQF